MSREPGEVHVERILGRRVRDAEGRVIGRVEELRVDVIDREPVVTEWHLGPQALLERLGGAALRLPFFRRLHRHPKEYRVPWQLMDLSDPDRPRIRCAGRDLMEFQRASVHFQSRISGGSSK